MTTITAALLVINAWSAAARKAAALKRKAKKMGGKTNPKGTKAMDKILSAQAERRKAFDQQVGQRPDPSKFKSFTELSAATDEWNKRRKAFKG